VQLVRPGAGSGGSGLGAPAWARGSDRLAGCCLRGVPLDGWRWPGAAAGGGCRLPALAGRGPLGGAAAWRLPGPGAGWARLPPGRRLPRRPDLLRCRAAVGPGARRRAAPPGARAAAGRPRCCCCHSRRRPGAPQRAARVGPRDAGARRLGWGRRRRGRRRRGRCRTSCTWLPRGRERVLLVAAAARRRRAPPSGPAAFDDAAGLRKARAARLAGPSAGRRGACMGRRRGAARYVERHAPGGPGCAAAGAAAAGHILRSALTALLGLLPLLRATVIREGKLLVCQARRPGEVKGVRQAGQLAVHPQRAALQRQPQLGGARARVVRVVRKAAGGAIAAARPQPLPLLQRLEGGAALHEGLGWLGRRRGQHLRAGHHARCALIGCSAAGGELRPGTDPYKPGERHTEVTIARSRSSGQQRRDEGVGWRTVAPAPAIQILVN
jgi:hypothetical protein